MLHPNQVFKKEFRRTNYTKNGSDRSAFNVDDFSVYGLATAERLRLLKSTSYNYNYKVKLLIIIIIDTYNDSRSNIIIETTLALTP